MLLSSSGLERLLLMLQKLLEKFLIVALCVSVERREKARKLAPHHHQK